jgi:hypothetical protein
MCGVLSHQTELLELNCFFHKCFTMITVHLDMLEKGILCFTDVPKAHLIFQLEGVLAHFRATAVDSFLVSGLAREGQLIGLPRVMT